MYRLVSENLTNMGGPMGTEHTFPNWQKYFSTIDKAKAYAEGDYRYKSKTIEWIATEKGYRSQDLGYVMYHIDKVEMED